MSTERPHDPPQSEHPLVTVIPEISTFHITGLAEEPAAIAEVLDVVVGLPHIGHERAIDTMDILMDRRRRILARRILAAEHGGVDEAEAILDTLAKRAKRSLGWVSHNIAEEDRTIRAHKGARRVAQVSGNLPGRTFRHLTSSGNPQLTRRWYFGTHDRQL